MTDAKPFSDEELGLYKAHHHRKEGSCPICRFLATIAARDGELLDQEQVRRGMVAEIAALEAERDRLRKGIDSVISMLAGFNPSDKETHVGCRQLVVHAKNLLAALGGKEEG